MRERAASLDRVRALVLQADALEVDRKRCPGNSDTFFLLLGPRCAAACSLQPYAFEEGRKRFMFSAVRFLPRLFQSPAEPV